jgi:S-adenosylmethionine decarboxylase proenzyme
MLIVPAHPHLLVDLYGCDAARLNDAAGAKRLLYEVASIVGATTIGDIFHQFSPHGVTGVLAIAESHISIHTWVEDGYAAVDLFLCNSELSRTAVERAIEAIKTFLRAEACTVSAIQRGAAGRTAAVAAR